MSFIWRAFYKWGTMFSFSDWPLFRCRHTATKICTKEGYGLLQFVNYFITTLLGGLLHRKHSPCFFLLKSPNTWPLLHFLGSWHNSLFTSAKVQLIALLAFVGYICHDMSCRNSVRGNVCTALWLCFILVDTTCPQHMQCFLIGIAPTVEPTVLPVILD